MSKSDAAAVLSDDATNSVLSQVRLAKRLVEQSFADKVFYANSGTEANEAALKFTRKHARLAGGAPSSSHLYIPPIPSLHPYFSGTITEIRSQPLNLMPYSWAKPM